ncbi:hypothetical protein ABZS83_32935 [Streptomyces sp. NPDC005426]|uniref:hypothetical protein n=1 Tax=Streptomyces sp. NPDC005426 TaxID=3155344 RepID=UPI0033B82DFE
MISEDDTTLAAVVAAREEFPDGTYGGPRYTTPDLQAAHVQELLEALEGWRLGDRAKHPWRYA